jgi:hypothetical protein
VTRDLTRDLSRDLTGADDDVPRLRRQLRAMAAHNEHLRAQLDAANAELARRSGLQAKAAAKSKSKQIVKEALAVSSRFPEGRRLERKFRRLVKRKGGVQPALVHVARRLPAKVAQKAKAKVAGGAPT